MQSARLTFRSIRARAVMLKLRRPIYSKTTNYGHFGKNDKDLTWEATNKVAALRSAL